MIIKNNNYFKILALSFLSSFLLVGCSGGGDDYVVSIEEDDEIIDDLDRPKESLPAVDSWVYKVPSVVLSYDLSDVTDFSDKTFVTTSNIVKVDSLYGEVREVISATPTAGETASNKTWEYVFDDYNLTNRNFEIPFTETLTLYDISGKTYEMVFDLFANDPYLKYQWSLYNSGDDYIDFTNKNPIAKNDSRIVEVWRTPGRYNNKFLSGSGSHVLVIDSKVDFEHVDLRDRMSKARLYSFPFKEIFNDLNAPLNEDYVLSDSQSPHGTAVAGIIGASKNPYGIRGIAYDTLITSFNVYSNFDAADIIERIHFDAINASYGIYSNTSKVSNDQAIIEYMSNKKGVLVVKSVGNYFNNVSLDLFHKNYQTLSDEQFDCVDLGIDCYAGQFDDLERSPNSVVVGAVDGDGKKAGYSSTSSAMWISAYSSYQEIDEPKIVSDFLYLTCDYLVGNENAQDLVNAWNGPAFLNIKNKFSKNVRDCAYTSKMGGTSAAAPSVTGVVALLKEAAPALKLHQLKYLLATTANTNNLDVENLNLPKYRNPSAPSELVKVGNSWEKNAAGLYFNNYYGFGILDAKAAIDAIENCDINNDDCYRRLDPPNEYEFDTIECKEESKTEGGFKYKCTMPSPQDLQYYTYNIENVGFNLNALELVSSEKSDTDVPDYCNAEDDDELNYYRRFAYYSVVVKSPNGTESVIKPYYAMYVPLQNDSPVAYRDTVIKGKLNGFYLENVDGSSGNWEVIVDSQCPLNLEKLSTKTLLSLQVYE